MNISSLRADTINLLELCWDTSVIGNPINGICTSRGLQVAIVD